MAKSLYRPSDSGGTSLRFLRDSDDALLLLYAFALFTSAFLLFSIQPMFAKMVLPRLGGSPATWSVAMLVFQALLLCGYGWAHLISHALSPQKALFAHAIVVLAAFVSLPVGVASGFLSPPETAQSLWVCALFLASIGLPFFAVSATAPLLQGWFSITGHRRAQDPYFLYGASNIGSFAALLGFPLCLELLLPLSVQGMAWTWGYALLAALVFSCGGVLIARRPARAAPKDAPPSPACLTPISWRQKGRWLFLAFVPSGLLVATTAHISTDIAATPLLWVIPLALYLLSYVLTFASRPPIAPKSMRQLMVILILPALLLTVFLADLWLMLAVSLGVFFAAAMLGHGQLAQSRPPVAHLTRFYLWMSFGGVCGGLFAALIAPALFPDTWEYGLLLSLVPLLPGAPEISSPRDRQRQWAGFTLVFALAIASTLMPPHLTSVDSRTKGVYRSFYGVNKVIHLPDEGLLLLKHGTTLHGAVKADAEGRPLTGMPEPLTYYHADGPMYRMVGSRRNSAFGLGHVGVVGLGVGSLSCAVGQDTPLTFFEIDRRVVEIARDKGHFPFLERCAPQAEIVLGDARRTLERQPDGRFDLLILDAFSSDAIPVHLMTQEALALYREKLTPTGVLLFHISNRHLDLRAVLAATAAREGFSTWIANHTGGETGYEQSSSIVGILARDPAHIGPYRQAEEVAFLAAEKAKPWHDDHSSIIGLLLKGTKQ